MIIVATKATFFLATWFLDPRSNYRELRPPRTDEQIARALEPYGLSPDWSVARRWWYWLCDVALRFDWGHSPTGVPVNSEIPRRAIVSGQLILLGTVASVIIGVALGVYTASRQYGLADRVSQGLSIVLFNVPAAVSALALVLLAVWLNQIVGGTVLHVAGASTAGFSGGTWASLLDRLDHLVLPTLNLTLLGYVSWHLTQRRPAARHTKRRLRPHREGDRADPRPGDPRTRPAHLADPNGDLGRLQHPRGVHRRDHHRDDLRLGGDGPVLHRHHRQERRPRRCRRGGLRGRRHRGRRDPVGHRDGRP